MSYPDDREAYLQGYEDAMRAAGEGQVPARKSPRRGIGARVGGRNLGQRVGEGIGYAIGWLIGFPVVMGLTFGTVAWLFGGDFASWALVWGVLMFLFALLAGAFILGFRLLLAWWPVAVLVVAVVVAVKLLG